MELRQLTSENERQIFAKCLADARFGRGIGTRETAHSKLGKVHLMCGDLYALFENNEDPPEQMVGGFIMHDVATFPLSCSKPDLSHLPSNSVVEGSELWSLSTGVGRIAGLAAAAVAGLRQAKAIVVYPIVRPVDLTVRYARFRFVNASEPVRLPYGETIDGGEIWVQPMILEGEHLEQYVRLGFDFLFRSAGGGHVFRFDKPFATQPSGAQMAVPSSGEEKPEDPSDNSTWKSDERNGSVSA